MTVPSTVDHIVELPQHSIIKNGESLGKVCSRAWSQEFAVDDA
jgi:hypothetical protein